MSYRTSSHIIALAITAGTGVTACGSEEVFVPQLGSTERLIEPDAVARFAKDDEQIEIMTVVGDLDGDGIDDAIVRTGYVLPASASEGTLQDLGAVYVIYGGSAVTGKVDLSTLPSLTDLGHSAAGIAAVGDVNGDGLADFLVGVARTPGCGNPNATIPGDRINSGAYLVYGSPTRMTGATRIADAGAFLRDATPCTLATAIAGVGDLDGDGKADFAIGKTTDAPSGAPSETFVFYGRAERLSGTVDLASTADAVIVATPPKNFPPEIIGTGDVDGDGYRDFIVKVHLSPETSDTRLIRGAATRLTGRVALDDVAQTQFAADDGCNLVAVYSGAALGDLDGDGVDDFSLVSCHYIGSGNYTMAQRVFYGRRGGFPALVGPGDQDATLLMSGNGTTNLAAGDVDGDGVRDLIVADEGLHEHNGGVHVITGSRVRLSGAFDPGTRATTYVGQPVRAHNVYGDDTGSALLGNELGVGDLTGDHRADILVSAPTDFFVPAILGEHGTAPGHGYLVSPPARTIP